MHIGDRIDFQLFHTPVVLLLVVNAEQSADDVDAVGFGFSFRILPFVVHSYTKRFF